MDHEHMKQHAEKCTRKWLEYKIPLIIKVKRFRYTISVDQDQAEKVNEKIRALINELVEQGIVRYESLSYPAPKFDYSEADDFGEFPQEAEMTICPECGERIYVEGDLYECDFCFFPTYATMTQKEYIEHTREVIDGNDLEDYEGDERLEFKRLVDEIIDAELEKIK